MTDGGRDVLDPRHLSNSASPAYVYLDDGERYVYSHTVRDSGWLWVKDWQGQSTLYPPHRVERIERVAVERTREGNKSTLAIVDDEARREARRLAQPAVEDGDQEAIADD